MKNKFFVLATIVLPLLLGAWSSLAAETQARWTAGLYGRSTDDSFSSSRTAGAYGAISVAHAFNESLSANLQAGAVFESGSASALFTNEFEPKSRLFLQEASLRWKPLETISLTAGALDQRHHQSPLLVSGGTFPAALAAFTLAPNGWTLYADAQAAIPTSRTLSTRSTGKEPTPLLYTQKLIAGWRSNETQELATFRATHFQYQNLTRGAAQDSRFYGNTVGGIGAASRFAYRFEGFELGPDLALRAGSQVLLTAGASYLQNRSGPAHANRGAYAYAGFTYAANAFSLRPRVEWYRNEADSAPAFYNSAEFGHNNRKGLGASLRLELPKTGLNFELKGRRSRLIENKVFQKDRFDYLELAVEIPYVAF